MPDWRKDSANLIEKYKQAELKGENLRAERYFEQAISAAGSAGKLQESARLHLIRCATRQASLNFEPCQGYLQYAQFAATAEDENYYRFLSGEWNGLDSSRLAKAYGDFIKTGDAAKVLPTLESIADPLSRLIAISLTVLRKQADEAILNLAAETASEQGWSKPLLVYLRLLESQAVQRNDLANIEKLRARIKLVEESL